MEYTFFQFMTLLGALGLFLYGMKIMSEGVQKLAGHRMRNALNKTTSNRFFGVITGFFITSIVQSSSASTVMVVSFVNVGLLSVAQSIGVIMGANIGTTVTAWLISLLGFKLNISEVSIPIIGIAFPMLFFNRDKINSLGEFLLGFALLFLGLELIKNSVPDLRSNPEMLEALQNLTEYGFGSLMIFLGIGMLFTIVLQSSSATMALTLVLCGNGWIGFEHGAAIVLGENIGTTLTANIAALIGNVNAKRTALAHTLFNIFGVLWMMLIFRFFVGQIDTFMIKLGLNSPMTDTLMIPIGLSIFHSSFNIINTFILIWFTNDMVRLLERILPSKGKLDQRPHLEYLSGGILQMAEFSILQARKEVIRYCELVKKMFNFIPMLIYETNPDEFSKILARIGKYEEITDRLEIEITSFLVKASRKQISTGSSTQIRRMRLISSEVEKVGDICFRIATVLDKKREERAYFTPKQRKELNRMFDLINEAFDLMLKNIEGGETVARKNLTMCNELENRINEFRDNLDEDVIDDIEKGNYKVKSGFFYNKIISSFEKVGDSIMNINEATAGVNVE
jgi:phosphate:Na+ symporter